MKKHDEGYVMLLVVVVILVLSIVSASLMSMTVANLKNQRNSVDRMQEKYSAQGELEKEIAKFQSRIPADEEEIQITSLEKQPAECTLEAVKTWIKANIEAEIKEENFLPPDELGTFHYTVLLPAETDTMEISCELKLTGTAQVDESDPDLKPIEDTDPDAERDGKVTCRIKFTSLTYTSYEITEKEVAE